MLHSRCRVCWLVVCCVFVLINASAMPSSAEVANFTITTQTVGNGWIESVNPVSNIPAGTVKQYAIHPQRGWMISNVLVDGCSLGPVRYATLPFVHTNHSVVASFEPFDQVKASNLSTKLNRSARVLIIGETSSANLVTYYLRILQAQQTSQSLWVEFQGLSAGYDLLTEYYDGRIGPPSRNSLLNRIAEGWDYVIPIDLYDYQSLAPELHLEGVRLIANRAWFEGGQARLILPMLWTDNKSAQDLSKIADHVYRIANAMRLPVAPVGKAWATVVANHGVPDSKVEGMSNAAAYLFATMLYVQFFEQQPDPETYIPNLDPSIKTNINNVVWTTWQTEKSQSHYSGAFSGLSTPFNSNGGRAYHFGTSTRVLSVDKLKSLIADRDPAMGSFAYDSSDGMSEASAPGVVQNNLNQNNYTYMWRQRKGEDSRGVLNTFIRGQFSEDPYFIWYERYADVTADTNARAIGWSAFREVTNALTDNLDTTNNPNRKSRSPQTHIGWGRIWEERTDIQMMENDLLHATGPLMSMFAAQTYALLTGRDASSYGSWEYDPNTQASLAEQARYAQRVGFETIMQDGYLDINEPYAQSPNAQPIFNQNSIFYTPPRTVYARHDFYTVIASQTLTVTAPGVLANDLNLSGNPLTVVWKGSQPTAGPVTQNPDGSFTFTPRAPYDRGVIGFRYVASDGQKESNPAIVWVQIVEPTPPSTLPNQTYLPLTQYASACQ